MLAVGMKRDDERQALVGEMIKGGRRSFPFRDLACGGRDGTVRGKTVAVGLEGADRLHAQLSSHHQLSALSCQPSTLAESCLSANSLLSLQPSILDLPDLRSPLTSGHDMLPVQHCEMR